jgi:hypothetical protein
VWLGVSKRSHGNGLPADGCSLFIIFLFIRIISFLPIIVFFASCLIAVFLATLARIESCTGTGTI